MSKDVKFLPSGTAGSRGDGEVTNVANPTRPDSATLSSSVTNRTLSSTSAAASARSLMKVMSYLDPIRETEVEEGEDLGHIQEKKKASSLTGLTPDAINDRIEQAVHTKETDQSEQHGWNSKGGFFTYIITNGGPG